MPVLPGDVETLLAASDQAAHDRAKALVNDWGILSAPRPSEATHPLRKLQAWYASHGPGGTGKGVSSCEMMANNLTPHRSVTIRPCYGQKVNARFVSLAFGGFPDMAHPTPAALTPEELRGRVQAAEITGKAVEAIDARIQWFRFELKYHPEDAQPASELALIVAPTADSRAAHYRAVQIPQEQARGIVDALAKDGFLYRGAMDRMKLNVLPPRPCFALKVSAGYGETSDFEHVNGERAKAQLRAVVNLLEGDARLALQRFVKLDDQEAAGAGDPAPGGEPK